MTTEILTAQDVQAVTKAADYLTAGQLVALPTETVYGLGANGLDPQAVAKIFAAKGRPQDNPLILHVADALDMEKFCHSIPKSAYDLAAAFWPGPLTMVLPAKEIVPKCTTAGLPTVAVRCPDCEITRQIIRKAGVPVAAPSANISGCPSPTSADHVYKDMNGRIPMILDGGESRIGVESTVIRLEEDGCTILRPGEIIARELSAVVGNVYVADAVTDPAAAGDNPESPGMKYKHYAPKARLVLLSGDDRSFADYVNSYKGRCAVLSYSENIGDYLRAFVMNAGSKRSAKEQMQRLFSLLRECDNIDTEIIFAHLPPKKDEFLALYNRIIRAAGSEVIYLDK